MSLLIFDVSFPDNVYSYGLIDRIYISWSNLKHVPLRVGFDPNSFSWILYWYTIVEHQELD